MSNVVEQILTGKDNATHDIGRWGLALLLLGYLVMTVWKAIDPAIYFDPAQYAGGGALILGGGAGALALKAKTEPDAA
jgi:hypothetical protein